MFQHQGSIVRDITVDENSSSPRFSKNSSFSEVKNCTKCVEVYIQLQHVLEELSSAKLIIQMLKNEKDDTTTSTQLEECELYTEEDWEVKSTKGKKGNSEGKMKMRNKEVIRSNKVTVEMKNRYLALATDDGIQENEKESENKTNVCEDLSKINTSMAKTNANHNKQGCTNTAIPYKELRKRDETRPNLQRKSITPRQYNAKGANEIFTIPTIINGRIPIIDKRYATKTHINHNLLLLGDSHIRGLADRIGCSLGNSFSVIGITKPNTDINGITSSRYFSSDNLTKHDVIIFCGGTRDISRNESKSGLCSLKDFAQRTSHTNVILLEAPIRYDLPYSSCVNIEVEKFNKKLRSLMTPFSHVRVISTSTERAHHTRHGLHLNKKGKHQVVDNLVEVIRNLYFPCNTNPPLALQGKDGKENIIQQVNPATSIKMSGDMEPPSPDEKINSGRIIGVRGVQDDESKQHQTPTAEPQDEESKQIRTPTSELRVEESKQHPTSTPELQDEGSKQHQTPTSKLQDDVSNQQPTPTSELQDDESEQHSAPVSELQEEELKQHPTQTLEQNTSSSTKTGKSAE